MKNRDKRRFRYLQDQIPIRLGGIAANLSRISSLSDHLGHQKAVADMIEESKWFIEWTAAELEVQRAAELVRLQLLLAQWEIEVAQHWQDEQWRSRLMAQAAEWSRRVLDMSGLLRS